MSQLLHHSDALYLLISIMHHHRHYTLVKYTIAKQHHSYGRILHIINQRHLRRYSWLTVARRIHKKQKQQDHHLLPQWTRSHQHHQQTKTNPNRNATTIKTNQNNNNNKSLNPIQVDYVNSLPSNQPQKFSPVPNVKPTKASRMIPKLPMCVVGHKNVALKLLTCSVKNSVHH